MDKAESAQERDKRTAETWFKAACVSGSIAMIMFGASAIAVASGFLRPFEALEGAGAAIFPYTFAAMCGSLIFLVAAMSGCQRALNRVKAYEDANGAVGEESVD